MKSDDKSVITYSNRKLLCEGVREKMTVLMLFVFARKSGFKFGAGMQASMR